MQVMALNSHNSLHCSQCQDLLKKVRVAESTIKFYQQQVNKSNRVNSQLKVQKIDLINQISELRLKVHSLQDELDFNTQQQIVSSQIEQKGKDQVLKGKKSNKEQYSQRMVKYKEQKCRLESELRCCKVRIHESVCELQECQDQLRSVEARNTKLKSLLEYERKIRQLMEQTIRNEWMEQKSQLNELRRELKSVQRRLEMKTKEQMILNMKLKSIESKCKSYTVSESEHERLKVMLWQKNREIRACKEKLGSSEVEKKDFKSKLQTSELNLARLKKQFSCELATLQSKLVEYNHQLELMEKEIEWLGKENSKLTEKLSRGNSDAQQRGTICQCKEYEDSGREYYLGILCENLVLKQRVDDLAEQNKRLLEDIQGDQEEQDKREVEEMKQQTLGLFKRLEQLYGKMQKQKKRGIQTGKKESVSKKVRHVESNEGGSAHARLQKVKAIEPTESRDQVQEISQDQELDISLDQSF